MKPLLLLILDGWGVAPQSKSNAITQAHLPFYNSLLSTYPHGILQASGEAVGLPKGEVGNTETGHLNIGAGYVVHQDLVRINYSIANGTFFKNKAFLDAVSHARKYESNLHLIGMVGSAGVHSNIEHLLALLELLKEQSFSNVFLHLITDGRDSSPKSSLLYLDQVQSFLVSVGFGKIATIMGRYYGMDRDYRWERTRLAYLALTSHSGEKAGSYQEAVNKSYRKNLTDEFILPSIIHENNIPLPRIKNCDSVIFFNFRIDRPRQLTKAFILEDFQAQANDEDYDPFAVKYYKKHLARIQKTEHPFRRGKKPEHLFFVTMTEYSQKFHVSAVAYPPEIVVHPIGESIAKHGLSQLRMAESEKERFVTYYFNGQREVPFLLEERLIIPSPKVATYDLAPEMSVVQLTDTLIKKIKEKKYHFIVANFANPDMVAHTGNLEATIKACESVDQCLSRLIPVVLHQRGTMIITGDHGNAEELINNKTGGMDTEHSTYPVPLIVVNSKLEGKNVILSEGILGDIAPTVLALMHIEKPAEMKGRNLLENSLNSKLKEDLLYENHP